MLLGSFNNAPQLGATLNLKIYAHNGYNAANFQNQVTELYFKTSNGSSNNAGFYGDGQAVITNGNNNQAPSQIAVVQYTLNNYGIYALFGEFTGSSSHYTVSVSPGAYWQPSGSFNVPYGVYAIYTPVYREIGIGQTWKDVTSSRSLNTAYTNTTGRPIQVNIKVFAYNNVDTNMYVDGVAVGGTTESGNSAYTGSTTTAIVPPGSAYWSTGSALLRWAELY